MTLRMPSGIVGLYIERDGRLAVEEVLGMLLVLK